MAYVSKENKAEKAPRLRALAKQFGLKATVARRHRSTLVLNIQQGSIDLIGNYMQATEGKREVESLGRYLTYLGVNPYWFHKHFEGKALEFLTAAMEIMNEGNHNRGNVQTDVFDVGWYCDINIGHWNKPYVLVD